MTKQQIFNLQSSNGHIIQHKRANLFALLGIFQLHLRTIVIINSASFSKGPIVPLLTILCTNTKDQTHVYHEVLVFNMQAWMERPLVWTMRWTI